VVNHAGKAIQQTFPNRALSRLPKAIADDYLSVPGRTLVLFFHGGLVDKGAATQESDWLYDHCVGDPSLYLVSFIWDTGWQSVLDDLKHQPGLVHRILAPDAKGLLSVGFLADAAFKLDGYIYQERAHPDGLPVTQSLRAYYKRNWHFLQTEDLDALVGAFWAVGGERDHIAAYESAGHWE
jgi:hypothetical protein